MATITYHQAISEAHLQEAAELVRAVYLEHGYVPAVEVDKPVHISPLHLLPDSATFMALYNTSMIGTVSVVLDSKEGLPMYNVFQVEIDTLRQAGKRCAEVTALALQKEQLRGQSSLLHLPHTLTLLIPLFKLVLFYSLYKDCTTLCISVAQKHIALYRSLGFKTMGELRVYPAVNDTPAVVMVLDLTSIREQRSSLSLLSKIVADAPDSTAWQNPTEEAILYSVEL